MLTGKDVVNKMERLAPKSLAYDWDNVGLQVGTLNKPVKKIMITLDVLENVVDEAINEQVDIIIAHHPLLFNSIKQINVDTPSGRIIHKLMKHDITVYAAHTNYDLASGGMNDVLAEKLQLQDTNLLVPIKEKIYKLVVYVPEYYAENVRLALGDADAGHIGNYSHCMFETDGIGSFKPLTGTTPFIGEQGKIETVKEKKVETIVTEKQLASALKAMLAVHPYEEPAYDLFPLANKVETIGLGRIGLLRETLPLQQLCEKIKSIFHIPVLRVVGDRDKNVKKVAIVGGSGKSYIHQAKRMGADVYITGDMTFHDAQDAWQMGLTVIDAGHYIEHVMKEEVKMYLEAQLNSENDQVNIITSTVSTDPFQYL